MSHYDVVLFETHVPNDTIMLVPSEPLTLGGYVARIKPGAVIAELNGGLFVAGDEGVAVRFQVDDGRPDPVDVTCEDLPVRVARDGLGRTASVCLDDDLCTVHDEITMPPPQYPVAALAADVRALAEPLPAGACSGTTASDAAWGWRFVWSSRGGYNGCMRPGPAGVEHWIVVERPGGGPRWQVRFQVDADAVEVRSVAPFTGMLQPFGAHVHCDGLPATFAAPENEAREAVALCIGSAANGACTLSGDTSLTIEDEGSGSCDQYHALELWVTPENGAYAYTGPGTARWTIESTSHGTLIGSNLVKDFPADTDVTVVTAKVGGTERWQVVFHWTGSAYTIVSVAPAP